MTTARRALRSLAYACVAAAGFVPFVSACSSTSDSQPSCDDEPVNQFQELLVVDEDVLTDPRSKNATAGAWSFRHAVENMRPEAVEAGAFVDHWLMNWANTHTLNGVPLDSPGETRDAMMNSIVVCPWLKRTPANNCDDACTTCTSRVFDLAQAPFRLIAITNRMDLREQQPVDRPAGEGRLLFGLTDGAADDPASKPLSMTVIFEYRLPDSKNVKEWADAWHALGKFPAMDEPYRAALQEMTDSFTKRGAQPDAPNGSAIGQVRSDEAELDWIWQQREFGLSGGMLELRPVRNTPAEALNGSEALASWLRVNAEKVRTGQYDMPLSMLGGSADTFRFSWEAPGVEEATRQAFALNTCNGCHGNDNPAFQYAHEKRTNAFQVNPFKKGVEKLSPFIYDPTAATDDVRARSKSIRKALCTGH